MMSNASDDEVVSPIAAPSAGLGDPLDAKQTEQDGHDLK